MKKRYSFIIRPFQFFFDFAAVNIFFDLVISDKEILKYFLPFISFWWLLSSYSSGFYNIYRYTTFFRILNLFLKQIIFFLLGYFAFYGISGYDNTLETKDIALLFVIIFLSKILWFIFLNKYRAQGKNLLYAIIIGYDNSSKNLMDLFERKSNLGFQVLGFFSNRKSNKSKYLGNFKDVFEFIINNEVDQVYCSLSSLTKNEIKEINKFCLSKDIEMKLIPEGNEFYSKRHKIEYYNDSLLVLDVKKLPFNSNENYYLKRVFDILFSLLVFIFIFPWLIPILFIVVKLESKGPLIFKQPREGLNGTQFTCYKFRSMRINSQSDEVHAKKNDTRVTKVGSFLRRTSLDELPQFINVLKGDMSVVGPRPHLRSLSIEYQKDVENYLRRHIVKPGITGLAQISGYRGEVLRKSDIKNRVRLDIFYIENWSFFLDLKIIIKTFFNMFSNDENAY